MNQHPAILPIAILMFATGIGIPILAALNADLGRLLDGPVAATFILFAVGFLLSGIILVFTGLPSLDRFTFDRPWVYFGAVFMLFYALSITWAAPRIGVGNAVFFVVLGQLVAAATIDHFGLLGAIRYAMTLRRAAGIMIVAVGVYLAKRSA